MPAPRIEVDARAFLAALRATDKALPRELSKIHRELATPIAADASRRIRSRSGRLSRSVRVQAGQKYGRVVAGGGRYPLSVYAPINHFGGYPGRYLGNEFLYDAADALAARTVDRYATMVDKFIGDVIADQ